MATPLQRILLPLDGSAFAESALPCAAAVAASHQAELLLAHALASLRPAHAAIDPAAMGLPDDAVDAFIGSTRDQVQRQIADRWTFLLWRAGMPGFAPAAQ